MKFKLTKEFITEVEEAIERNDADFVKRCFSRMHAADITSVLHELETNQSKYVLDLIDIEIGAEIISDLEEEPRKKFLKSFSSEEIAKYINFIDSDDAVDILNEQPVKTREEVIALTEDEEKAEHILNLLHYDEDCAGGLMAVELIKARADWTVLQCINEIRRQAKKVEKFYSVYVVDNNDRLVGRVSIKNILLDDDDTKIADLYKDEVISVETYRDANEVAAIMQKYDLEAIPVVNVQGKLLGRITIDDVIDVITEQAESERQLMSGISENVEEDSSIWMLSRARLPWLIIGVVGGLLCAKIIGLFEKDLIVIPAMAFFIPLIIATGGNVGVQSSSLVVQSLASKTIMLDNLLQRLLKQLLVACINGIVISGLVFALNAYMVLDIKLALVVSTALFAVVILASFMGTITPIVLDKLNINPALASGPFITTVIDLLGLAVYFVLAHLLYNV
ncbi:MAG: magnesium transporter [Bacteroidetes bacterium]|nr:magnesium transporter [Bacteroidota bacterium]